MNFYFIMVPFRKKALKYGTLKPSNHPPPYACKPRRPAKSTGAPRLVSQHGVLDVLGHECALDHMKPFRVPYYEFLIKVHLRR